MASIGHVIVGIAGARLLASPHTPLRDRLALSMGLSVLSLLPDADVIAFWLHIPYAAPWGHRGASHSLLLAGLAGALCGVWLGRWQGRALRALIVCVAVACSHGLLDAITDGGLGVALLWPWDQKRIFFPLRPLPVAPIGLRLFSRRGLWVLLRETLYFLPLLTWALWPRTPRASRRRSSG